MRSHDTELLAAVQYKCAGASGYLGQMNSQIGIVGTRALGKPLKPRLPGVWPHPLLCAN